MSDYGTQCPLCFLGGPSCTATRSVDQEQPGEAQHKPWRGLIKAGKGSRKGSAKGGAKSKNVPKNKNTRSADRRSTSKSPQKKHSVLRRGRSANTQDEEDAPGTGKMKKDKIVKKGRKMLKMLKRKKPRWSKEKHREATQRMQ